MGYDKYTLGNGFVLSWIFIGLNLHLVNATVISTKCNMDVSHRKALGGETVN